MQIDGALEECSRCGMIPLSAKQEVDRVDVLVDRVVQVLSLAADVEVGLVHPPTQADWFLAPTERGRQHQQYLGRPAVQRGVE